MITHVIKFKKPPTIVCSSIYSPDFDFSGNQLQDFNNIEIDLENLIVSIFPTDDGGFALLSYLDTAAAVCERMIKSILNHNNLTTALIWFVFGYFENIAMQPDWYESLSSEMKNELKNHFLYSVDPTNMRASRLDLCPPFIDDWQPEQIFKI